MSKYYYRVYVGPSAVKESADRLANKGFLHIMEGTEHVYFASPVDAALTEDEMHRDTELAVREVLGYLPTDLRCIRKDS